MSYCCHAMHEAEAFALEPREPIDCGPASPYPRPTRPASPLSEVVHWASWESELIALDLRSDRYVALGPLASRAAARALVGGEVAGLEDEALLAPLVERGLLRGVAPVAGGPSAGATAPAEPAVRVRPPATLVAGALLLVRSCDRTLRRRGLGALLERLRREASRAGDRPAGGERRADTALRLAAAHARARLFTTASWHALPAAAALGLHAWRRGLPARVVLGVQRYPFRTRAWVELEGRPLGDGPDPGERMQPIFVVEPPASATP
jgi:Transglutaminase-like superfamily